MSIGFGSGFAIASIYAFIAAPAAFAHGEYDSRGWTYMATAVAFVIGGPAFFYYLALRQERELEEPD